MRQFTTALANVFLVVAVASPALAEPQDEPLHVVVVSIDGLRPDVYRDPEGLGIEVPNLLALRQSGVSADRMIPTFPSVTYPSHTTLVTGTTPAAHGIETNFKSGTSWYLDSAEIRSETLWQAAAEAGLTTAIVTWPVSYGANVDYLIPENLSLEVPDVPGLIREGSTPGLFDELAKTCGPIEIPSFDALDAGEKLDRVTACFGAEVIRRHQPNLLLVHFLDADHQQHFMGPNSREALHAFELIDAHIGSLRRAARDAGIEKRTVFVIVGDHGFVRVHTNINIDGLLLATGFAELGEGGAVSVTQEVLAAPLGGSCAFYVRDASDTALSERLKAAIEREIDDRYRGILTLVPAEELERLGAFPGASFALAATQGYMLTRAPIARSVVPTSPFKGMHGHLPSMPEMATGFIASGPGLRSGLQIPVIRQLDVAPTLAQLVGVRLDQAAGHAVAGIFVSPDAGPGLGLGIGSTPRD